MNRIGFGRRNEWLIGALLIASCGKEPDGPGPTPQLPAHVAQLDAEVAETLRATHSALLEDAMDPAGWAAFGMACEANGLLEAGAKSYAGAGALEPAELKWPYRRAVCRFKLGEIDEAVKAMREAVALEPNFAPAHVRLSEFLLEEGAFAEARASSLEATILDPGQAVGWWGLARAELELNDARAAVDAARRALSINPDEPYAHHLLGTALRRTGQLEQAAVHLELGAGGERIVVDPFHVELAPYRSKQARRFNSLRALTAAGRHGETIPLLNALLAEDQEDLFVLNKLSIALGAVGRAEESLPLLERALSIEPLNLRTNMNLAVLLKAAGRTEDALARLNHTIELQPLLARAHELKGSLLRSQGRLAEALPALQRAVELDERNARIWVWIGTIHMDDDAWPAAAECFERAVTIDGDNADLHALFAVALSGTGKLEEAHEHLKCAEKLAPEGTHVLRLARQALAAKGGVGG